MIPAALRFNEAAGAIVGKEGGVEGVSLPTGESRQAFFPRR